MCELRGRYPKFSPPKITRTDQIGPQKNMTEIQDRNIETTVLIVRMAWYFAPNEDTKTTMRELNGGLSFPSPMREQNDS
jgi:hypothetical protein